MNALIDNHEALANGYLAMAQVFSYPDADAWQRLREYGMVDPELDRETLEADYLTAFEMGRGGPAVPLYEGLNRPDQGRDGILQELLRFYEFFDARLNPDEREYPDHLVTELEFLGWLSLQAHAACRDGRDAQAFYRAARDFLDRHVGAWVPEFNRRLAATDTAYGEYSEALVELVQQHRARLDELTNGLEA
ncbi:MAG: molecular chaperone TorD family protein [Thiobacillus sp.]